MVDILDAQLLTISVDGDGSGTDPVLIGQAYMMNGQDGAASENDVSHFGSTATEFILGLVNEGGFKMGLRLDPTDVGQIRLTVISQSRLTMLFTITLVSGWIITFSGWVKSISQSSKVDSSLDRTCDVVITGEVTKTPPE